MNIGEWCNPTPCLEWMVSWLHTADKLLGLAWPLRFMGSDMAGNGSWNGRGCAVVERSFADDGLTRGKPEWDISSLVDEGFVIYPNGLWTSEVGVPNATWELLHGQAKETIRSMVWFGYLEELFDGLSISVISSRGWFL